MGVVREKSDPTLDCRGKFTIDMKCQAISLLATLVLTVSLGEAGTEQSRSKREIQDVNSIQRYDILGDSEVKSRTRRDIRSVRTITTAGIMCEQFGFRYCHGQVVGNYGYTAKICNRGQIELMSIPDGYVGTKVIEVGGRPVCRNHRLWPNNSLKLIREDGTWYFVNKFSGQRFVRGRFPKILNSSSGSSRRTTPRTTPRTTRSPSRVTTQRNNNINNNNNNLNNNNKVSGSSSSKVLVVDTRGLRANVYVSNYYGNASEMIRKVLIAMESTRFSGYELIDCWPEYTICLVHSGRNP